MPVELVPIPLPASADPTKFKDFGREVKGVDLTQLTSLEFEVIEQAVYKHGLLLFRNVNLSPEQQYALTKRFDPNTEHYGHGNNKVDQTQHSILHAYLKTIPRVPQVQLIGHGTVYGHEGIPKVVLKHGHHKDFHKTRVSEEDESTKGYTRFFRWHMDAALYDLSPPKVTTLYGLQVPKGPRQTVRYDDGTGDELSVSLGTTAFVNAKTMFDVLSPELKNLAVRAHAKYSPRPFEWMSKARAYSTGLGLEVEGLEKTDEELGEWSEDKVKIYPFLWKNPVTGDLHLQIHGCAIKEIYINPLPKGVSPDGMLYPNGAHLTDLTEVRRLCYQMQRPGITPHLVYPHEWRERDLIIFHNRGLMHSVVGVFKDDQVRVFHQCNLASGDEPLAPDDEDIMRWT